MDLGNPWLLLSSVLVGMIGIVLFRYGYRQADFRALAAGGAMLVYPYFVSSTLVLWLVFGAIIGALYLLNRFG